MHLLAYILWWWGMSYTSHCVCHNMYASKCTHSVSHYYIIHNVMCKTCLITTICDITHHSTHHHDSAPWLICDMTHHHDLYVTWLSTMTYMWHDSAPWLICDMTHHHDLYVTWLSTMTYMWHDSAPWFICDVFRKWVMSRIKEACHISMSHVTHERVMSRVNKSYHL